MSYWNIGYMTYLYQLHSDLQYLLLMLLDGTRISSA